jgi:hypothetical protein
VRANRPARSHPRGYLRPPPSPPAARSYNDYFTHHVGDYLDLRHDAEPDRNQTGVYETHLITQRVTEWIGDVVAGASSPAAARSFAYVAHQAMHAPQQVPAEYVDRCVAAGVVNATDQPIRAMACGQVVAVDDSVGELVAAYRALGILDDTFFIFTAGERRGSGRQLGGAAARVTGGAPGNALPPIAPLTRASNLQTPTSAAPNHAQPPFE